MTNFRSISPRKINNLSVFRPTLIFHAPKLPTH
jgi:hypothetical protein